jgi:HEAT repeat protein
VRSPLLLAMLTAAIETPSDFEHGWSRNRVITAWFVRVLKHEVSRSTLPAVGDSAALLAETTGELELHAMHRILEPIADGFPEIELPREASPASLALAERIRLLRRSREGTLEFAHLLFLDHFAMPALAKFCAGLPEDESWSLASGIVDSVGARAAEFVVDFARRATNESVKMLATATAHIDTPAYVPALLAFDHHNTGATDIIADGSFARLGRRALEPLRARLLGPDDYLRERAAARLARIGQEGVDVLIAAASDTRTPVRHAALTGLVQATDAKVAACARAHVADPAAAVRTAALHVIAAHAPGSLGDHVLPLLDDADADARRAALATLGSACSPAIEKALTSKLDSEHDKWIRAAIAAALARCGSIEPVLRALKQPDADQVAAAVQTHAALLPTESLAPLIHDHPNERVRENLCYALTGRADAAVPLADLLKHDRGTYVRVAAARALTAIGKNDVVLEALGNALLDGGVVGFWAASGLGEIGSDQAARALWRAVENRRGREHDRRLERSIEQALDHIDTALSREMLSRLPWRLEQ